MKPAHALIVIVLLAAPAAAGCLRAEDSGAPLPPFPPDSTLGDTRLFARVGEPGRPEGIALEGDLLFVSSASPEAREGPVLVYDVRSGELLEEIALPKAAELRGPAPGATGMAVDGRGRVYVAELGGARILRIDPRGAVQPEIYAEIPDLPPCAAAPLEPCAPTAGRRVPLPNYPAFGPDGALYVSDSYQHTIFRVPPGGEAEIWYQEPRFHGFGMNGIAFSPQDDFLYVAQSVVAYAELPTGPAAIPVGAIWRLPFRDANPPLALQLVHEFPGGIPDGIAFGVSGRLYVTIIDGGLTGHGISVLSPDGTEEAFFPSPQTNNALDVPYDGPASVVFHDFHRSILVTNQAAGRPENWAVLESFVDDVALPLHRPEVP